MFSSVVPPYDKNVFEFYLDGRPTEDSTASRMVHMTIDGFINKMIQDFGAHRYYNVGGLVFSNREKCERAVDWMNSILMMEKLRE